LLARLEKLGIANPIICTNVNKLGFRMCGGMAAYEEMMTHGNCRLVAMSVFASGALSAEQALEYVCRFPQIRSIVFGASSRIHIAQTRLLIEQLQDSQPAGSA
jgi:phosphoribosylformimino-5-aminoimidazole carboxamide ribonucleotide (ProFAR) isomerase